ncbi:MAG: flagellar filament capping protein FliD, partial [Sedimentisphaerales bacterium]
NLINNDEKNPGVTASLVYQGGKYHLMLSGQEASEDYQISVNASNTEVWEASSALTVEGENAGLTTKITDLDTFNGTLGTGDNAYITIGGTRTDETTFTTNYTVTANTTVGHIIDEINSRFEVGGARAATATLVNGKICLTDNTCGASSLVLNTLTYNHGSGSTTLSDITFAESVEGGTVSESLASLASTSFTQTQNAQSSQIKIDDYTPTAVPEVQTLSTDAAPTGGHYHLSYGGETTGEIAHDATYAQIQARLEEDLSTVNTGDITVSGGGTSLEDGPVIFTFLGAAGNVGLIAIDSELTNANGTVVETVKGNNSEWVSGNSNSITNALTGVTLNLHDITETGKPIKITISKNTSSVTKKIQTMVTAYNDLITELKDKTEYNADTKKMGILSDDMGASLLKSQSRTPFIGAAAGFINTIDSFIQASDIGLTIDGAGMMQFDTTEFNNAINEDFTGILELLGATKSGNSSSSIVQFYAASDKYTTAGTYNVKVKVEEVEGQNVITEAWIKLASESTYRTATRSGTLITGNSEFDADTGAPKYPENSLQLSVPLVVGTYGTDENPIIIHVKQGIAGAFEDFLNKALETDGRFDISQNILDDKKAAIEKKIENEQTRLDKVKQRLVDKYARLEKTITLIQQQLAAVNQVTSSIFGN